MNLQYYSVVKSEYVATNLMDFMYLPEKQFYDVCDDGIVPHFDCFQGSSEPFLFCLRVTHSESLYILPIRMTPYGVPFDINMHDSILEKERTIEKDHIFVSSEAESTVWSCLLCSTSRPSVLSSWNYGRESAL